ncbi:transposable element Tc3 transposase [Trichonephila clavipes]|nr:transposable element Tc3 transposase [Trichonephila clavipes]
MSSGRSLPQINLSVQGGIQGDSHICNHRGPCIGLGLPPYTIITHSVKRRQSVELVFQTIATCPHRRSIDFFVFSFNQNDCLIVGVECTGWSDFLQGKCNCGVDGQMCSPLGVFAKPKPPPRRSDEAPFWLNGYVNKQNCRIWSEANPQVYVETPLHPEKLTVWCALWAGGIIGPYFFKNDEGHNVTVNGDRYRAMITNFFIPELNNHDVQELWFRQDVATCHTARATIDLLKDTFGDRRISRFGPVTWPPRSCDLTPLDYFLWGFVKSLVYADKPQTLDHLEDNIRRVIADIRPQMLEKVIENWTSRLDYIQASRDSPMPEIIFKM